MGKFTIAYDGEIIPHHVFRSEAMAENYLYRCGFEKISSNTWELSESTIISKAEILEIDEHEYNLVESYA